MMPNVAKQSGQGEDGKVSAGSCIWKLSVLTMMAPEEYRARRQISVN